MSKTPKLSISLMGYWLEDFGQYQRYCKFFEQILGSEIDFGVEVFFVLNQDRVPNWDKLKAKFEGKKGQVEIKFLEQKRLRRNGKYTAFPNPHNLAQNEYASGKYRMTATEDIVWERDSLQKMVDFMEENEKVAIMAPRVVYDNGKVEPVARRFPKYWTQVVNRIGFLQKIFKRDYEEYHYLNQEIGGVMKCDWVCGHLLMMRGDFWERVGGKDERYFRYMTDTDLCRQAWEEGWEVVYNPEITVRNKRLLSSKGGLFTFLGSRLMQIHLADSVRYFVKWNGQKVKPS